MSKVLENLTLQEVKVLKRVRAMSPEDRYFLWIIQREKIRLAKEAGKSPPWTDDPILRRFRFTNPRRMDDKVSDWLYQNWYKPYFNHPNMVLAVVLARHFNQPSTLKYVGFPSKWEPDKMYHRLLKMKAKFPGRSVFNGAYMIRSSSGSSPIFYPDKCEMVIRETVQQFVDNPIDLDTDSMENSVEAVTQYRNFGTFMAGQVVSDLRWAVKGKWKDKNTWAAIGPGSRKGMNNYQGRDPKFNLKQEQFIKELREVRIKAKEKLPATIFNRLEMGDLQNCFCEIFKYEKGIQGIGKPKQNDPGQ